MEKVVITHKYAGASYLQIMMTSVLQAEAFKDAEHGDIAPLIRKVLKAKVIIESPVFFRNRPALFSGVGTPAPLDTHHLPQLF